MTAPALSRDLARALAPEQLLVPGSPAYDVARRGLTSPPDHRPQVVVVPRTGAEVGAVLRAARRHRAQVTVLASGHGSPRAVDHGVMMRTHGLGAVVVDPERRVARIGAGNTWDDVVSAAAPHGLMPVTGTHGDVGAVGFTLGGGKGWLSRRFGLGADNLLRAECVLADGSAAVASPESERDLFWALRGAGAGMAVVTSITVRLHRISALVTGRAWFSADRAADVVRAYRDWAPELPDTLSTAVVLGAGAARLQLVGSTEHRTAAAALESLWSRTGPPDRVRVGTEPASVAVRLGGIRPRGFEVLPTLGDEVIGTLLQVTVGRPSGRSTDACAEIRYWGGEPSRDIATKGPAGHRDSPWSVTVDGPAETVDAVWRHSVGRSFRNFAPGSARTPEAHPPDQWQRVVALRRRLDPDGMLGGAGVITGQRRRDQAWR